MGKSRYVPDIVLLAKEVGDIEAIRAMGRRGGLATQQKRRAQKELAAKKAKEAERLLEAEMLERAIETNEEIVTPDGEEGLFPDGPSQAIEFLADLRG